MAAGGRHVLSGPFVGDGRQNPHRSELLPEVELDETERGELVAFLLALSDANLVEDPTLASPFVEDP